MPARRRGSGARGIEVRAEAGRVKNFPDLPPIWAMGAALASWLLATYLPVVTYPTGVGRFFIIAGLGLIFWSAWWFRKKATPIEPRAEPKALIVEGPYRINRNPIYTGLVLMVGGYAIGLGAVSALLPALVFPVVIHRRFVLREEEALKAAFGAEAERYFKATRRW
jgi:protein-S-isoprenylcysteine O-methyltransferase Ste14